MCSLSHDDILEAIRALPGVANADLEGSAARGQADKYSDVDVLVTCARGYLPRLWLEKEAIFRRLGELRALVDVSDIVKYSAIGFVGSQRIHLEFRCAGGCTCPVHDEPPLPDVMSCARLIFWVSRLRVALGRGERLQAFEAALRCVEFQVYADALRHGTTFRGLKGDALGMALIEGWLDGDLIEAIRRWNGPGTAFADLLDVIGSSFCSSFESDLLREILLELGHGDASA